MLWCVLLASCGAALPIRAAAQARPLGDALTVERGSACVKRDTLAAQVAAWLGRETIDRDLSVRVSARDPREVSFELRRGPELLASRRFAPAPAACAPLEAILALAIAMALEVSLRDELLVSLGTPHGRRRASLAALAEWGFGLLPGRSAGAALRAGLRVHRRVALHFEGLAHTSRDQALAGAPVPLEVDAWLLGVRAAACLLLPVTQALIVSLCGGLAAGSLQLRGEGQAGAGRARLPWAAVAASAELGVALSARWSIAAGGSVEIPLGARSYGVREADGSIAASDSLPRVAGSLRAGPVFHF